LDLPDCSFDVVICLHVLAHISNDRAAIREMFRVLRPNGVSLIMTPMNDSYEATLEDPTIIDPVERDKLFGEWDFVRVYGRDFVGRLTQEQFRVDVIRPVEHLNETELAKMGVWNDQIFLSHKPSQTAIFDSPRSPEPFN